MTNDAPRFSVPYARKITDEEMRPYKEHMENVVIPKIVESIRKRKKAAAKNQFKVLL